MSRERVLVLLGILTALAPFLGLPYAWLAFVLPVLGIAIAVLALSLPARTRTAAESHVTPVV